MDVFIRAMKIELMADLNAKNGSQMNLMRKLCQVVFFPRWTWPMTIVAIPEEQSPLRGVTPKIHSSDGNIAILVNAVSFCENHPTLFLEIYSK